MNFKAHTIGGMLSGIVAIGALGHSIASPEGLVLIAGATVGGLLPDIDHRGSYLGSKAKVASFVVNKTLGHRGATHSPIIMGVLLGLLYVQTSTKSFILAPLIIGLALGVLSHILLDCLTIAGVPLLYPFSKKKFSLLPLKSGGKPESVITVMMASSALYLLIQGLVG